MGILVRLWICLTVRSLRMVSFWSAPAKVWLSSSSSSPSSHLESNRHAIALHIVFLVLRVSAALLLRTLMSDAREGAQFHNVFVLKGALWIRKGSEEDSLNLQNKVCLWPSQTRYHHLLAIQCFAGHVSVQITNA